MIYRLNNKGFKAIMSNSSAFYFDMSDDKDMENSGKLGQVTSIIKTVGELNL